MDASTVRPRKLTRSRTRVAPTYSSSRLLRRLARFGGGAMVRRRMLSPRWSQRKTSEERVAGLHMWRKLGVHDSGRAASLSAASKEARTCYTVES